MKKVHIFWYAFFSEDGLTVSTGGVQTYLINLTTILNELGYEVHFYRPGERNIECEHYNIKMHGFKCSVNKRHTTRRMKATFNFFKKFIDKENDIVIFAEDYMSCKTDGYHVMALQHGIYWDKPDESANSNIVRFGIMYMKKVLEAIRLLRHSTYFDVMVCVDYNYVNWYRALMPCTKTKLVVNPNFAPLFPVVSKPDNIINIMFARRFVPFRGTRVFCVAITRILEEYDNVHVTLAGWGSDEKWLHDRLDKYGDKIEFTTYSSGDTFAIHSDKHIAVVPTVGSEGTSLSLLEAMSSQCAVIGSDVGGITNVIIDGYNGLMVPANDASKLYEAIKKLIDNPDIRIKLAQKGYETIAEAFSIDRWKANWRRIIMDYVAGFANTKDFYINSK